MSFFISLPRDCNDPKGIDTYELPLSASLLRELNVCQRASGLSQVFEKFQIEPYFDNCCAEMLCNGISEFFVCSGQDRSLTKKLKRSLVSSGLSME